MSKLLLVLTVFLSLNTFAAEMSVDSYAGPKNLSSTKDHHPGYYTYFDWARGNNGWGYCYEFDDYGVLHGGRPVRNFNCERVNPSHFAWGRGFDGYVYCYQWTPYRHIMNDGYAVHPRYCHY